MYVVARRRIFTYTKFPEHLLKIFLEDDRTNLGEVHGVGASLARAAWDLGRLCDCVLGAIIMGIGVLPVRALLHTWLRR